MSFFSWNNSLNYNTSFSHFPSFFCCWKFSFYFTRRAILPRCYQVLTYFYRLFVWLGFYFVLLVNFITSYFPWFLFGRGGFSSIGSGFMLCLVFSISLVLIRIYLMSLRFSITFNLKKSDVYRVSALFVLRQVNNDVKNRFARMAAAAAWGLGQWSAMEEYVNFIPKETQDGSFYRSVLAIHRWIFPFF